MTFFSAVESNTSPVNIVTSNNGGLDLEQIAELAVDKIVYVSDYAPAPIQEQAHAFRKNVKSVLMFYLNMSAEQERATICNKIRDAGQSSLADLVAKI